MRSEPQNENAYDVVWRCGHLSPVFSVIRLCVVVGEQFTDEDNNKQPATITVKHHVNVLSAAREIGKYGQAPCLRKPTHC